MNTNKDRWWIDYTTEQQDLLIKSNEYAPYIDFENIQYSTVNIHHQALDKLLMKNKLLQLAHAMLITKNGECDSLVDIRLSLIRLGADVLFKGKKEYLDIYRNVHDAMEMYLETEDGNIFRDCKHNYFTLFTEVSRTDPELYKIYLKYVKLGLTV